MYEMDPIYPVTALQKKFGEVKGHAKDGIVRITENGVGAYVFCSEEVFRAELKKAAEEAAYEARVALVIERGRADIAAGRYYKGTEAFMAEIEKRRAARG